MELVSAVATVAAKDVAGKAFAVDTDQDTLGRIRVPLDECQVFGSVEHTFVHGQAEFAVSSGQGDGFEFFDEALSVSSVLNEALDGAYFQVVLGCEFE